MQFNSRQFFILSIYFSCVLNKILASICTGNTYYDLSSSSCRPYFSENVTGSAPWGIWRAQSYDTASPSSLNEARGYGRDVTISGGSISKTYASGNGAGNSLYSLDGGTTNTMQWPNLPVEFTICSLTRYTSTLVSDTNRKTILTNTDTGCIFQHGHRYNARGVIYGEAYSKDFWVNRGTKTDWLVACGQNSYYNSDTPPNNIIIDGLMDIILFYFKFC